VRHLLRFGCLVLRRPGFHIQWPRPHERQSFPGAVSVSDAAASEESHGGRGRHTPATQQYMAYVRQLPAGQRHSKYDADAGNVSKPRSYGGKRRLRTRLSGEQRAAKLADSVTYDVQRKYSERED